MFVPKTVYENAPYYWLVLGALLIALGLFYARIGNEAYFFAGMGGGTFACIWGALVLKRRLSQKSRKPCSTYDEYLDQTMELNLRDIHPSREEAPAREQ